MALLTRALEGGRRNRVVLTPQGWRQIGGNNFVDDGDKQILIAGESTYKP